MPKNIIIKLLLSVLIFTFGLAFNVQASPQSDYDYQLTQYRKHNAEFQVLKEDNQKTPTLDNQQKALQAAKQAIISRETAKITYIELFLSSIKSQNLSQEYMLQTEKELVDAQDFFKDQTKLAKNIVSVEDLTNFTLEYLKTQPPYQSRIIKAQATRKLAILIRLQINAKNAYDDLLPKISDKSFTPVSAGLEKITQLADSINKKVSEETSLISASEVTYYSRSNFYRKRTEGLSQIKALQLELVNTLIDLEKNYAN